MSDARRGYQTKTFFLANIYERNCPKKNPDFFVDTEHEGEALNAGDGGLYMLFPGCYVVVNTKRVCSGAASTRYVICTPMVPRVIQKTATISFFPDDAYLIP